MRFGCELADPHTPSDTDKRIVHSNTLSRTGELLQINLCFAGKAVVLVC